MSKRTIKNREKLIFCGLFLSKFDKLAIEKLGFNSFIEAFNILGYALGGKPASIKNYRDEFDPYFDNPRNGWVHRDMREYCRKVYDDYKNLSIDEFYNIIQNFINPNYQLKQIISKKVKIKQEFHPQRIATGLAAEEYFMLNYERHFQNYHITDTRFLGCGFDFKLDSDNDFYVVEVKGLSKEKGNFILTQKEYDMANELHDRYCLYVVKNFKEKPIENVIFNPIKHLDLKIITINYQGVI